MANKAQALAEAAADRLIAHGVKYSEMIEHSEWHALAAHYLDVSHVKGRVERDRDAESKAFYAIGVQVGLRLRSKGGA